MSTPLDGSFLFFSIKNYLLFLFVLVTSFAPFTPASYAVSTDINLSLKNNGVVIYSGNIPLPAPGMIDINDSSGNPHPIDALSVLSIIHKADLDSSNFNISNLMYYSSFGAFYLKCITVPALLCDNWQYKVDGTDPGVGMDTKILSGGERVVLFFGRDDEPSNGGGGPLIYPQVAPESHPVLPAPLIEVLPNPTFTKTDLTQPEEQRKEIETLNLLVTKISKLENKVQKIENLTSQNKTEMSANVVNTLIAKTEPVKKEGLLSRFFNAVYSFFLELVQVKVYGFYLFDFLWGDGKIKVLLN